VIQPSDWNSFGDSVTSLASAIGCQKFARVIPEVVAGESALSIEVNWQAPPP